MKHANITYDSFKKIMALINYLDKSAASMIEMLNDKPSRNEFYFHKTSYYKCVLAGIQSRAQKIKSDWIIAAAEQNAFSEKIANIGSTYENMQKDFKVLYELSELIFEVDYFIDQNGFLVKKIRAEVRNEN